MRDHAAERERSVKQLVVLDDAGQVEKVITAVDVGTVVNQGGAEGQIEGGVVMGLGYALTEEIKIGPDGRVLNPNFMDYKIFCADDMPKLSTILVEAEEHHLGVRAQVGHRRLELMRRD